MTVQKKVREIIDASKRIVFFGGAGVSTASGIPDFRSAQGLYAEVDGEGLRPEMILSRSFFYLQPEAFFKFYRKHRLYQNAKPNAAHRFLYELEVRDQLRGIVTQNIDGLHKAAGNIRVYELHGNVHENYCMECNASYPMETILRSEGIPRCECGGVIKPSIVLYDDRGSPRWSAQVVIRSWMMEKSLLAERHRSLLGPASAKSFSLA